LVAIGSAVAVHDFIAVGSTAFSEPPPSSALKRHTREPQHYAPQSAILLIFSSLMITGANAANDDFGFAIACWLADLSKINPRL
jgi:hypothetical protein